MGSNSTYFKEIITKLERLVKKEHLQTAITGIQLSAITGFAGFTFFSFVELIGNFISSVRTVFIFLFILIIIASATYLLIIPVLKYFKLFRKETYFETAKRVGNFFPSLKDDLLNAMQLVSAEKRNIYSDNLIDASFKNVYERSKSLKFESVVNFIKAKKILPYFIWVIVFCAAVFGISPGMQAASYRLINFNREFISPPEFIFEISPGNIEITKGQEVLITARIIGTPPKEVFIAVKREDETDFSNQKISADSSGIYIMQLSSIRNSFKYFATAEDVKSEIYEVKVIDRPIIENFELSINPPAYSKIPKIIQKDNGNVTSLVGTTVKINLSSTKNLTRAFLHFNDSSFVELITDENNAAGTFTIRKDNSYTINIIDTNENSNVSPVKYQVKALYDAYPSIELITPDKNLQLPNDNRIALFTKISDDYGFSKLVLNYRLSASRYEPEQSEFRTIEIPINKSLIENSINYIWNLTPYHLAVDDVVTYYVEVFDNDNISGPKSTRTQTLTIRVPSLDEILADADDVQDQVEMKLEETLKEAEQLQKTLEKIDQDMKKDDKKLSWEEKEKIENALDKFQELQQKVDEMNNRLGEMKQKLQENNLLSKETLEKYMELQELMDQMTSEDMRKMMEKMQQLLQQMNRDLTQDALENMKMDEEKFKKSIERTLNLLKRIQVEQKLDELIKRTEELNEKQQSLMEQTEQSDPSDQNEQNEISKKQDEISKQLERLKEEMKSLEEKMSELKDMPMEEMQEMSEQFEQQQNQELSEEASENLQKQLKQKAMKNQSQLCNNMGKMSEMMMEMQESMQEQNQVQTFTDMMKILENLLTLSKKQEDLKQQSQNMDSYSSSLTELAQQQKNLSDNLKNLLQQMADLSQKTFAISPEMGEALGKANQNMQMSIESMQNRNGSFAGIQQTEAMKNLNEAATMMKNSMESMMQSGGQGGMMSLMQQLQQMSGQQMNLNNMTQMLQQMTQGGMSPQQQQDLQRLSQQQELIRKSMEQLNEEAKISGQSKKLPTDLDNVLNQMQEVITDMNTQKLDDDLIQKQEKILSKMLDAQRSINERDFEKERESRTGQTVYRDSPNPLNLYDKNSRNKIRDELNRAIKEGYMKDYEELIRKYYEALQKEEIEN
ncbi:MAG TPA: DUF4175 family protein [Ignavibacteriaceae bacterium]|nr:DUF4175 family protein [Ignavibacteriaceae bacterium]